ncbi:MAG: MoxR family ATPase [Deltaproteobacteria bacterium]|nr:MoxR family ATPase [Deltaproteobacteria bacterium]
MGEMNDKDLVEFVAEVSGRLRGQIQQRIVGQETTVELMLVALLSGGHCLITGVPGLAKTLLVKSLAEVTELAFSRVQFTPDLMPSDITGTEVIEEDRATGRRAFTFVRGPVFANLLLADEVNRTPPKTQGALLQAMQELQVTIMGKTYPLEPPFHVLATQNPIEQEGTYPLPEALLDRFMLNIQMDYPSVDEERRIVRMSRTALTPLECVVSKSRLLDAQALVDRVPVGDHVAEFVVKLVRATRPGPSAPEYVNEYILWGAGPRAAQNLLVAAKARALLLGTPTPRIEDVAYIATAVLKHRLVMTFKAETERVEPEEILKQLVKEVG